MIKAFLISFRLRNTYKANGFIYFLRQLPLVKKLIPAKAYKSRGLKRLANVVAWIREFVTAFLWKGIYLLIVFGIVLSMHEGAEASAFLNAFFFLTLAGGFLNTQLFDPTNDKYYAIILMGMNAKDYTVSNYIYFLIKVIVGFLPLTCLFAFLLDLGPLWGVGMMLYVLFVKLVFAAFILWDDVKDSKLGTVSSEEEKRMAVLVWIAAALLCVLGFGLPYTGLVFPVWVYGLILGLLFLMSVPSAIYIFLCRDYQRVCRELLKNVAALYLAAAALGGVMYALDVHTNTGFYIRRLLAGETTEAMPLFFWTFLLAGGYFGVRYLLAAVWSAKKERDPFYRVTLCYQGKEGTVTAFLDTGNRLKEPVTKRPVHILTYEEGIKLCETVPSFIYIPFSSIGMKNGMLPGIFLDSMTVEKDGKAMVVEKPLIAIVREPLSPDNAYQMLLNETIDHK